MWEEAVRPQIPLQATRPIVVRTSLFDARKKGVDTLRLSRHIDEVFRSRSVAARGNAMAFVDAADFPDAYRIGGEYQVEEKTVKVGLNLYLDKNGQLADVTAWQLVGSTEAIDALAQDIADGIEARLAKNSETP